jgi:esterase/lipase
MKSTINKSSFLYLFAVLTFSFIYTSNFVEAQSSESKTKKPIKYKKSRALSPKVSKKMIKVYDALEVVDEKGDPAPDMETVIEILTELKNDAENLKSYDRSVMWNSWG